MFGPASRSPRSPELFSCDIGMLYSVIRQLVNNRLRWLHYHPLILLTLSYRSFDVAKVVCRDKAARRWALASRDHPRGFQSTRETDWQTPLQRPPVLHALGGAEHTRRCTRALLSSKVEESPKLYYYCTSVRTGTHYTLLYTHRVYRTSYLYT